jgi:hypothetical protein
MNLPDNQFDFSMPVAVDAAPKRTCISFRINSTLPAFVLPTGMASQLALDPVLAPVPNVKSWLRGVLNLRGNLVPVFDIGLWQGIEALPASAQVLVIAPGPEAMGVLCCETPSLLAVYNDSPVLANDAMSEFSSQCFDSEHGKVYEFNPQLWLRRVGRQVPGRSNSA